MEHKLYDIVKLSSHSEIDMGLVRLFFSDNRDYFEQLAIFQADYQRPLAHYTPAFVINSPSDRERFLTECYQMRVILMQLGMRLALHELDIMEDAAHRQDMMTFADGQVKFLAAIIIYQDIIAGAQIKHLSPM